MAMLVIPRTQVLHTGEFQSSGKTRIHLEKFTQSRYSYWKLTNEYSLLTGITGIKLARVIRFGIFL